MKRLSILILICSFLALPSCSYFEDVQGDLRSQARRVTLDNGMRVILLKREGAPLFAAHLRVKVGSIEENDDTRGLAHMFEHLAFKGTETIGTPNFALEKPFLEMMLKKGTNLVKARQQGASSEVLEKLQAELTEAENQHKDYFQQNEYVDLLKRNGAVGFNATTNVDFTSYYVKLPSHKLELWMYMESERLKSGSVFREFFKETLVILEERKYRLDNKPGGQLMKTYLETAFADSPFGHLPVGGVQDILTHTPDEAREFYEKFYAPSRMVAAIVGDFDLDQAESWARKYFGAIPSRPTIYSRIPTSKLQDVGPVEKVIHMPHAPRFWLGYHRAAYPHPDDVVFDFLQVFLCSSSISVFKEKLIDEKKVLSSLTCSAAYPGQRLASTFLISAIPVQGVSNRAAIKAIRQELETLMHEGVDDELMTITKNRIEANYIFSLASHSGLARQISFYELFEGDWATVYDLRKKIQAISEDDIKRVLKTYFIPKGEVSVLLERQGAQQ